MREWKCPFVQTNVIYLTLFHFPSANVTCHPTAHYILRTHYCKVCISERIVPQPVRVIPAYLLAIWEFRSCFSVLAGVERAGKEAVLVRGQ